MNKKSTMALGTVWFGAAMSMAEIEAGAQCGGNWIAIASGHIIGGLLLFAVGLIGARTGRNAMETAVDAFGRPGGLFFAALNVMQLVGWTAVMVSQGSLAVRALSGLAFPYGCAVLSALVAAWIFAVEHDRFHLTTAGVSMLAVLAAVLTFRLGGLPATGEAIGEERAVSFWPAFEISIAMPLSWLPLVSDYTRAAKRSIAGTAVSAGIYTVASIWMYVIGTLVARSGSGDLAAGIVKSGIGIGGLVVVVFSTVTTTFLDAYSSGESVRVFAPKSNVQLVGMVTCAIGAVLAVSGIVGRYVEFLYLIASVFAPMAAVLTVSYYLRRRNSVWNMFAWLAGTLAYHFAGSSPIGSTLTALLVSGVLAFSGPKR